MDTISSVNNNSPSFGMALTITNAARKKIGEQLPHAAQLAQFNDSFARPLHSLSDSMAHDIQIYKNPLIARFVGTIRRMKNKNVPKEKLRIMVSSITSDKVNFIRLDHKKLSDANYLGTKYSQIHNLMFDNNQHTQQMLRMKAISPENIRKMNK